MILSNLLKIGMFRVCCYLFVYLFSSYPWTEEDLFDNLTAADVGLTRIESDPLVLMLKRLEAASKLTSDNESLLDDPYLPEAIY